LATTSQLSVTVRPVLTPPWTNIPAPRRALMLASMPFQCSICFPKFSASVK
jgi:hypothetical protein